MRLYNGKKKAVTFSFDDGVTQDIRAIEIMDKYGLKGTFNLNSELFGARWQVEILGCHVPHIRIEKKDISAVYRGQEIAAHTKTHPNLTTLKEEEIIEEVKGDVRNLEDITGKKIVGFAYPGGGVNFDGRVAETIRKNTDLLYARTTVDNTSFAPQKDLLTFSPTVRFISEDLFSVAERFLSDKTESGLLYVWGHAYEMDGPTFNWQDFERFCVFISGREDVFYGTNSQTLL